MPSENVTEAIDNLTTYLNNLLGGYVIAVEGIEEQLGLIASYVPIGIEVLICLVMIIVTLWVRKEEFLYITTSLITGFVAFDLWDTFVGISIVLIALSLYFLEEAVRRLFLNRKEKEQ